MPRLYQNLQTNGYLPNTLLKGDIRQLTNNNLRIIATFRKDLQDIEYQEITYLAKKVEWSNLIFPDQYEPLGRQIIQTLSLSDST